MPDEGIRNIDNYICGFIKKEICAELKKSLVLVRLPDWDNSEEEENGEDGCGGNAAAGAGAGVEENFIVSFEDPFAEMGGSISSWEVMQECYKLLETEEPEFLIIFDEKSKGHQNIDIAKYLSLDVKEIENLWKRVVRLLRKEVYIHFS